MPWLVLLFAYFTLCQFLSKKKELCIYNMTFGLTWYCLYKLKEKLISFPIFSSCNSEEMFLVFFDVLLLCILSMLLYSLCLSCGSILEIFKSLIMFSSFKDLMESTENNSSWKQFFYHLIDFVCIKMMLLVFLKFLMLLTHPVLLYSRYV